MKVTIYLNDSIYKLAVMNELQQNSGLFNRKVEITNFMEYSNIAFQTVLDSNEIKFLENDNRINTIVVDNIDKIDNTITTSYSSTKYQIFNAGTKEVNGVYTLDINADNTYPEYFKNNMRILRHSDTWRIIIRNDVNDDIVLYSNIIESLTPPLTSWIKIFGDDRIPYLKSIGSNDEIYPDNSGLNINSTKKIYYDESVSTGNNKTYFITDFQNTKVYSLEYKWQQEIEPEPEPEPEPELEPEPEPIFVPIIEPEPLHFLSRYNILAPTKYYNIAENLSQSTINFIPLDKDKYKSKYVDYTNGYIPYYDKWNDINSEYNKHNIKWKSDFSSSTYIINPENESHALINAVTSQNSTTWTYSSKRSIGIDANGNQIIMYGDDSYKTINILEGFRFYGKIYNTIHISTNGYITFGIMNGDTSFIPKIENHLGKPRISFLYNDLEINQTDGKIYYGYSSDEIINNSVFVITYQNISKFNTSLKNNIQILLYLENGYYKNRGKILFIMETLI